MRLIAVNLGSNPKATCNATRDVRIIILFLLKNFSSLSFIFFDRFCLYGLMVDKMGKLWLL